MLSSIDFHPQSPELSDIDASPVPLVPNLDGISISKEIPFEMDSIKDESFPPFSYNRFHSRRQTFDEGTSNFSTITSDELPCFEPYSFSTAQDRARKPFSGKSLFSFGDDWYPQDPYFSNHAYGCSNTRYSCHRCSYDFDYPPGLTHPSFDSEDFYSSRLSPDLTRSSFCNLDGEVVMEGFGDFSSKPYSNHYSLFDKPSRSQFSYRSDLYDSFDRIPVYNSISFKEESNSSQLCTPSCDETVVHPEPVKESKLKESAHPFSMPKADRIETMEIKSTTSLPPMTKPRHKGPVKKVSPEVTDDTPGNPDDIDPTVNPRVFSGKKPKKNMDYSRFVINIERVKSGEDTRLTVMLKNIPNGFTQSFMLEILDSFVKNEYDFFYMPVDFKTNCNLGFGYVSMTSTQSVINLYNALNHKRWPNTPSTKICEVNYARMQGRNDMQKLCKDWAIMQLPEKYRPVFFEKSVIRKDGKDVVVMKRTNRPL